MAYAFSPRMSLRAGVGSFANRPMINRDTALGGNAPFQIQESVVNGVVDAPSGATQRAFPFTQTIQDPVFKIPTAWAWNTTFQREVVRGTSLRSETTANQDESMAVPSAREGLIADVMFSRTAGLLQIIVFV